MMYSSSQMKFQAGRLSALRCHNLPFWEHFESLGCTLSPSFYTPRNPVTIAAGGINPDEAVLDVMLHAQSPPPSEARSPPPARRRYSKKAVTGTILQSTC
jgi:hypothetical protein